MFFLNSFSLCRASRRRKTIIHRNEHRSHIQEVQVGAVGLLEEEGEEGVGIAVVDGDNILREGLVPMTHL